MHKELFVIRHCQAEGQEADAPLTSLGKLQAEHLAKFLVHDGIERIISSPFMRAAQSIEPLAQRLHLIIEFDVRLVERKLSSSQLSNWYTRLQETFADFDLCFEGGESSRTATQRVVNVVENILRDNAEHIAIVSHGNLTTLLLKHFDNTIGFETWKKLTNPDVFRVQITDESTHVERIWKAET